MTPPTLPRKNPWLTTWNVWIRDREEDTSQLVRGDTMAEAVERYLRDMDTPDTDNMVHVCAQAYVGDVQEWQCQWRLDVAPVKR